MASLQSIAKADYVSDIINETDQITREANSYYNNVLTPAMWQRYYYLQSLASLCYQGDTTACYEYNSATQAEYQRLSNAVNYMRTRENPY